VGRASGRPMWSWGLARSEGQGAKGQGSWWGVDSGSSWGPAYPEDFGIPAGHGSSCPMWSLGPAGPLWQGARDGRILAGRGSRVGLGPHAA
jgi:hypothetical protein